jgi:hypothetical protein
LCAAIAAEFNMQKSIYFFAWCFLSLTARVPAQPSRTAFDIVKEEQEKFIRDLRSISIDPSIASSLINYFESELTQIHTSLQSDSKLSELDRDKAAMTLVFFMKELSKNLGQKKINLYEMPATLKTYHGILKALLEHRPVTGLLMPLDHRNSQLLAEAFSQYKEHSLLDDITVYKRMSTSPEFIIQFLEKSPRFRFSELLLLEAASHDPEKIVSYLNENRHGIQEKIRQTNNIYLKKIVSLSGNKYFSELMPFILPMAENTITPDEILEQRTDVIQYFQLLVNTLQDARRSGDPDAVFLRPLRTGLRQKSLAFYVNEINDLHNAADAVRFASVKNLRPQDIYYIITSSGEELYTSSYLGLYKRLMDHFGEQSADSLFEIVRFDNFHTFMRLAANYNVLADFLHRMPREKMYSLLQRFITGIETDANSGLERAMDIGDSFSGLGSATDITDLIRAELKSNLERCKAKQQYLGIRLYGILLQVFELVGSKDANNQIWATLGNYEVLKRNTLLNKDGKIVQLVLFYGDEDGVASFQNFLKLYADNSKWKVSKNENWVSITSVSEDPLIIYANLPLEMKTEMDLRAQDKLVAFLAEQSQDPVILVHRGHSYHLDKTLKRLSPSVKLAILGSCGSYNKSISIAGINPDVQVIGSKKKGSMSINDPIIEMINESLVGKNDLVWPEIWKKLGDRFGKDKETLNLFNEYFPPSNNLSLFVLKLFVYYN